MSNHKRETNLTLKCCENGSRVIQPFDTAYERFWRSNYAWLVPADWYKYDVEGHSGSKYVYPVAKTAALRLGFLIHTRKEPLTIDDLEAADEMTHELTMDAFVTRAYRFNRLFGKLPKELRPFQYAEILNDMGIPRAAYRVNPERTYFVVLGVASGHPQVDIDWSRFRQPPKASSVSP